MLLLAAGGDPRHRPEVNLPPLVDAVRGAGNFNWQAVTLDGLDHFLGDPADETVFAPQVVDEILRFVADSIGLTTPGQLPPPPADAPARVVIEGVRVVDVREGRLGPESDVVVSDGRITAIGPASVEAVGPGGGFARVDGRGRYLMPGLFDMHGHVSFFGLDALPRMVTHGVLSVRDMGGDRERLRRARDEIAAGRMLGPRLLMPGPFVDGEKPNYRYRRFVSDAESATAAVDELVDAGVDFIKVHSRVPPDAYDALAVAAADRGIRFAGHVPFGRTPLQASDAGQASIEHADSFFSTLAAARHAGVTSWREARDYWTTERGADDCARLARNGTFVTPTLVTARTLLPKMRPGLEVLLPWMVDITGQLHRAGVPIVAGTDFGRRMNGIEPGAALHEELELLVTCGLSPADAIAAATIRAAELAGLDGVTGEVREGLLAELVLVDGNPLEDVRKARAIVGVYHQGRWITKEELLRLRVAASP